ncbi:hypothetical protein [Dolichospermum phage Dfl-JY45]
MRMMRAHRFGQAYSCERGWVKAQAHGNALVAVYAPGESVLLGPHESPTIGEIVGHVKNDRYRITYGGEGGVISAAALRPSTGYHADPRWQATVARLRDAPDELLKVPHHLWTPELVYTAVQESGCFNSELASPVARAAIANGALDADVAWALARTDPIWLETWLTSADQLNTVDLEALTAAVERIHEFVCVGECAGTGKEQLDPEMLGEYFGVLSAIRGVVRLDDESQALLERVFYLAPELFDGRHPVSNRTSAPVQPVAALAASAIQGAMAVRQLSPEEREALLTNICLNCRSMFSDANAAPLLWRTLAESEAIELLSRVAAKVSPDGLRAAIEQGLAAGVDLGEVDNALAAKPGILGPLLRLGAQLSTEQVLKSGLSADALADALFENGKPLHPAAKEACWAAYGCGAGDVVALQSPSM